MEKKTGKSIIKKLKRHFSSQGIPNELFSDNGPPFNSLEFNEFAQQYESELRKSSPNYPQSNGRVENAVKTAKQLLKKSISAGHNFYLTLLDWRNTPSEGLDSSPAQRLLGRRTRTLPPTAAPLLKPETQRNIREKLLKRKEVQTKYYNCSRKELPPLKKDNTVRVHPMSTDRQWFKAKVEEKVDIRSYVVQKEDGQICRRNRRHLRAIKGTICQFKYRKIPKRQSQETKLPNQKKECESSAKTTEDTSPGSVLQPDTIHSPSEQGKQTRSGRAVKLPSYLNDFILTWTILASLLKIYTDTFRYCKK